MGKFLKVLVAEGNQAIIDSLRLALQPELPTAEIVPAASAADALALAGKRAFDVAFIDLALPDSTGLAAIDSFARALPSLPLIALAGADHHELAHEAIRSGAQDYLITDNIDDGGVARAVQFAVYRKRKQITLEFANAALEEKVRHRTAQLHKAMDDLRAESHQRVQAEIQRQRARSMLLKAIENEQRRLGRDLHDGIQGNLAGVSMLLGSLRQDLLKGTGNPIEQIDTVCEAIGDAINQVRGLARSLCPIDLKQEGLLSALGHLARTTTSLFHVQCDFVHNRHVAITEESVAGHLYYISHEAINNALKHGKAGKISILMHVEPEHLRLAIEDDGVGIPPDRCQLDGMGLRTMAYRASVIGADLTVRPGDTKGTIVECRLGGNCFSC